MHGVILGTNLCDYTNELSQGDLVVVDDGFNDFVILEKVDPRYGKQPDDHDTAYKYFVRSKSSGVLMNYARCEISKASIAFYDYTAYYTMNKKVLLGAISLEDINHIKGKYAVDLEIPFSEFNKIKMDDIIGLDFHGTIETKKISYKGKKKPDEVKYFKIYIKE